MCGLYKTLGNSVQRCLLLHTFPYLSSSFQPPPPPPPSSSSSLSLTLLSHFGRSLGPQSTGTTVGHSYPGGHLANIGFPASCSCRCLGIGWRRRHGTKGRRRRRVSLPSLSLSLSLSCARCGKAVKKQKKGGEDRSRRRRGRRAPRKEKELPKTTQLFLPRAALLLHTKKGQLKLREILH